MACKDIIVNIANYDPLNTYTVIVKLIASVADYPVIPAYSKVATGPSVLFTSLPDGEYEAGIRMTCATGGSSSIVWQRAITASCIAPQAYVINAITATAATLNWTAEAAPISFQYRLDQVGEFAATSAAASHPLAGLITGKVYEAELRKKCATYAFSAILNKSFATSVIIPTFRRDVLEKICDGYDFRGYRIRFSITGGLLTPGTYRINYTTINGVTAMVKEVVTTPGMTIYQLMVALSSVFNVTNMIVGTNYGAFDIISTEPKSPPGVPINCQDIDLVTGYTAVLV